MSKILIVAEHLNGQLNAATAKCVSAAQALSPEAIDIVVLAADPAAVAAQAAQIAGVTRVLTVANPANEHAIAQVLGPQIAALATGYSHVFGPSTTFGKDLMPVVAALLGVNQISDLMAVERDFAFVLDASVAADAVVKAARSVDRQLIEAVSVFDLYEGKGVPEGKKSLAVAVRLQPKERTLTEAEIDAVAQKIVNAVTKATGGILRS